MNADCRWWGTSVKRVQILSAMLALLAVGSVVLGWSSRSHRAVVHESANASPVLNANGAVLQNAVWQPPAANSDRAKSRARSLMAGLPLMFEPNEGQGNLDPADERAKFVARGAGYMLALGDEGAILSLSAKTSNKPNAQTLTEAFQMKLVGANRNAAVRGTELLPGKSNYLIGNDPAKWKRNIPQFARVRYEDVYPGVNLVFYGNQGKLEYDFQVAPGADPKQAELEFDGAKRLAVKDGALVVTGKNGSVQLEAPQVYQEIDGRRQSVQGNFVLLGENRAGFSIGQYDRSRELVIDPLLVFSTFYGGAGNELNNYVAVDLAFNVYLAGSTTSSSLPGPGTTTVTGLVGTQNVYIAKITPPAGSNPAVLVYATYLGGSGTDYPVGIGVDGNGDPYVAGTTNSTNFPVSLSYQTSPTSPGNWHVFVTRLTNTASTLLYSSYLSGSGNDYATGMTIDQQGYIYVTGTTTSTNPQDYATGVEWPVIQLPYGQPFQNVPRAAAGVAQFFVSKINTAAGGPSSIAYSTYFGGGTYSTSSPTATGGNIAVDSNLNIYFTGTTNFIYTGQAANSDFPILNPYQPCLDVPAPTVIVNPATCTYTTQPTASDAFVAKLNPNASGGSTQLVWSTYIGGSNDDSGTGVALDPGAASVYVTGTTNSTDIGQSTVTSTTSASYQRCLDYSVNPPVGTACTPPMTTPYPTDAFIAKLGNLGVVTTTTQNLQMTYFSFLGGSGNEEGLAIAVDSSSGVLLTGWTQSACPVAGSPSCFPVSGATDIQGSGLVGTQDAFVARLNTLATIQNPAGSWSTYYGGSGVTEGTSVAIDNNENTYFAGDTTSTSATLNIIKPISQDTNNNGGSDAYVAEVGTTSSLTISGRLTLGTDQTYISAGTPATFTYTITNAGSDPAYNISVTDDLTQGQGLVNVTFNSATASSGTCSGGSTSSSIVCTIPSLLPAATATVTVVVIPSPTTSGFPQTFTGGTVSVTSSNNITPVQTSVAAQMSDFTVGVTPSTATVGAAGDSAIYQVQFTPHPVYTTSISMSCSGVPAGAACNFTPSSISLNGPGTAGLTISTTAPPIITPASLLVTHNFYATIVLIPILGWLAFGSANRRRRRIVGTIMLATIFWSLWLLPACSTTVTTPPVSGTPAGLYTIIVNATAGSDTKSTTVQLQVP